MDYLEKYRIKPEDLRNDAIDPRYEHYYQRMLRDIVPLIDIPPSILGWTRMNNHWVMDPELYGEKAIIVMLHEKSHNKLGSGNEYAVQAHAEYLYAIGDRSSEYC